MSVTQATDRLRRAAIEPCVLLLLEQHTGYAHDIVTALAGTDGLVTSEGTVYPMLSRLRREGLVTTEWQESPSGPPRKYFRLTPEGEQAAAGFKTAWGTFRHSIDSIVAGEITLPGPSATTNQITVKETS